MYKLLRLFKILLLIWGIMIFVQAPEISIKIIACVVVAFVVWRKIKSNYNSKLERQKAERIAECKNRMMKANDSVRDELKKHFNAPISKAFNYAHERFIFVSEVESLIMVDGITFSFSQLLSCDLEDNQRNFSTTTMTEEKQSSSYLDWMINTDAGRIVDAINAPVTRNVNTESVIYHNYTLKLTLDSLSNPYLLIHLGDNEEKKNSIKSVFDVIIHRNRKQSTK